MKISRAEVSTANGVSLLRKLCHHWSHEHTVEFDNTHGKITLPNAYVTLIPGPAALSVYLETKDEVDQDRMEGVVARHLQRFGFGEELTFHWLRS